MDKNDYEDQSQTVFKEKNSNGSGGGKSSTGLDENIASLLCYLAGFITGIIFYLIEKESDTVRFHAMQSIALWVSLFLISIILSFIPIIGWVISLLIAPLSFVLWIFMMYQAYQGGTYKLPIIGDFAESQIKKQ